jgi:hypothetical protein
MTPFTVHANSVGGTVCKKYLTVGIQTAGTAILVDHISITLRNILSIL